MLYIIVIVIVAAVGYVAYLDRANLAKDLKDGIHTSVLTLEAELKKGEDFSKAEVEKVVAFLRKHL